MVYTVDQKALEAYRRARDMDEANRRYGRDDYLPSSNPDSPHKHSSATTTKKKKTWNSKPKDGNGRSDEWLGRSPTSTPRRSWKVKATKSPAQMARDEAESSDDGSDDGNAAGNANTATVSQRNTASSQPKAIPNLDNSFASLKHDSDREHDDDDTPPAKNVSRSDDGTAFSEITEDVTVDGDGAKTHKAQTSSPTSTRRQTASKKLPSYLVVKKDRPSSGKDASGGSVPSAFASVASKSPLKFKKSPVAARATLSSVPVPSITKSNSNNKSNNKSNSKNQNNDKYKVDSTASEASSNDSDSEIGDNAANAPSKKPGLLLRPDEFLLQPNDNLVQQLLADDDCDDSDDDSHDDQYHVAMKNKLKSFLKENPAARQFDSDSDDDSDDEDAATRKEGRRRRHDDGDVPQSLTQNGLDHIILACSDFTKGLAKFEKMTGLRPTRIGSLRGVGSKSARIRLDNLDDEGDSAPMFLELIGPDPTCNSNDEGIANDLRDSIPDDSIVPYHYAVRNKTEQVKIPTYLSWDRDEVIMVHANPEDYDEDHDVHKWDLMLLYGHGLGGCVPAYVNWHQSKYHPTVRLEHKGATLTSCEVQAPEDHYVHTLLQNVDHVELQDGSAKLTITLDTPKGEVSFSTNDPEGLMFPGFGDDNHPSLRMAKPRKPELLETSGAEFD